MFYQDIGYVLVEHVTILKILYIENYIHSIFPSMNERLNEKTLALLRAIKYNMLLGGVDHGTNYEKFIY